MFFVVAADRNAGMAALAQRHEISRVVCAAVCQRQDVMHFLRGRQPAFALTLLAKRMRLNITRTDSPPCSTVTLAGVRVALIFVVMMLGNLPVLVAIPAISQSATAGVGAGTLGSPWHIVASSGQTKSHRGFLPGGCRILFRYRNTIT